MVRLYYLLVVTLLLGSAAHAQSSHNLARDMQSAMQIPDIVDLQSSSAHLYVLSESEGLAVFRAHADSLQWLITSEDMHRRGHTLQADIRFAYLFGEDRRITVIEPTSLVGVYSSAMLPERPVAAERIAHNLYIVMQDGSLGQLSLETPELVSEGITQLYTSDGEHRALDIAGAGDRIHVLTDGALVRTYEQDETDLALQQEFELEEPLTALFMVDRNLYGSDEQGGVYRVDRHQDALEPVFSVEGDIERVTRWREAYFIRDEQGRVWISEDGQDEPFLYRDDRSAGNLFTVTQGQFWMNEYGQLTRMIATGEQLLSGRPEEASTDGPEFELGSIPDQVLPYSRPLLLHIPFEGNYDPDEVTLQLRSRVEQARIRDQGFFWQPGSAHIGENRFTVVGSTNDGRVDSTSFSVNVRRFNSPPRFSPVRPVSIVPGEAYSMNIRATDPDGMNRDLIRYIGVDLPDGASIDERTGEFEWTPERRQVGRHTFQVIATDQYGAASSLDVEITVREMDDAEEDEEN